MKDNNKKKLNDFSKLDFYFQINILLNNWKKKSKNI